MALGLSAAAWVAIGTTAATAYVGNKAAKTQANAADAARETGDRQYDQTRQDQLELLAQQREDQKPYREAGVQSLAELMRANAPGGEFDQKYTGADLANDPGYLFRLQQGEAAATREAAASGNRYSGGALKALARFNSGLASQEFGAGYARDASEKSGKYNRLASLAGIGQLSTNQTQQAGTNAYGQIGQLGNINAQNAGRGYQDAGEARASGYVGVGNAITNGISSLYNGGAFGNGGPSMPFRAGSDNY